MCELTIERLIIKCGVAKYEDVCFSDCMSSRRDIIPEVVENSNAFFLMWSLHLARHAPSVTMQ